MKERFRELIKSMVLGIFCLICVLLLIFVVLLLPGMLAGYYNSDGFLLLYIVTIGAFLGVIADL